MTASSSSSPSSSAPRKPDDGPAALMAVDVALSTAVITPAVVTYWRITWMLMDIYLLPEHRAWSTAASVAIGFFGMFVFTLVQHRLKSYLRPRKHTAMYYVISRSYTAAFAYSCVNSWRGVWDTMDMVTGTDTSVVAASLAVGICAMASMRTLRNVVAPPIVILTDNYDGYFEVPTLFRIGSRRVRFLVLRKTLYNTEYQLCKTYFFRIFRRPRGLHIYTHVQCCKQIYFNYSNIFFKVFQIPSDRLNENKSGDFLRKLYVTSEVKTIYLCLNLR